MENELIKVIVVDDESKSRITIKKLLEFCSFNINVVAEAGSVSEAIEVINANEFDILFLDINLGNETAFNIFSTVTKRDFEVVFVTAFNQYAEEAFKVSAIDYLLKPFTIETLEGAIQKYLNKEKSKSLDSRLTTFLQNSTSDKGFHKIALPVLSGFDFVVVNAIIYCQADGNYTNIFIKDKEKPLVVSKQIGFIEQALAGYDFVRPHNSYLINLNYVDSYIKSNGGSLKLNNKIEIPIARNRKDSLKHLLGI